MNYDEMFAGMKVVVWDWSEEYDDPPDHWADGMDDYIGAVVTVSKVLGNGGIHIFEDDGEWMWDPGDFDYYECLPYNNPNITFRRSVQQKKYEEMKKENERHKFLKRTHKNNYG